MKNSIKHERGGIESIGSYYRQSRRGFLTTMTVSGISVGAASAGSLVSTISHSDVQHGSVSAYLAHSNGIDEALENYPGYAHAIFYPSSTNGADQGLANEGLDNVDPQLSVG